MKLGAPHNCGDSKLSCVDCEARICPSCMVQCAVGNRCKGCTERFTSHVTKVPIAVGLRTFAVSAVIGALLGFGLEFSLFGGFFAWIALYFVGMFAGRGVHKIAQHKLGKRVIFIILAGVLVGTFVTPGREMLIGKGSNSSVKVVRSAEEKEATAEQFATFAKAFQEDEGKDSEDNRYIYAVQAETPRSEKLRASVPGSDKDKFITWLKLEEIGPESLVCSELSGMGFKSAGRKVKVEKTDLIDWTKATKEDMAGIVMSSQYYTDQYENAFAGVAGFDAWVSLFAFCLGIVSPIVAVKLKG